MTMQEPRREIRELSPEEQAEKLARLRQRYRLQKKIKEQGALSRQRRAEETIARHTKQLFNDPDDRLKKRIERAAQRTMKSIADLIRRERTVNIRRETRAMHLAYGFIRNVDYGRMEQICYTRPNWERVKVLVEEHSRGMGEPQVYLQKFAQWIEAANAVEAYRAAKVPSQANPVRR